MNELGCCGIQGIWKRGGAALCMRPRDLSRPRDLRGHPTVDQTSGSMAELFSYSNLVHAVSGAAVSASLYWDPTCSEISLLSSREV